MKGYMEQKKIGENYVFDEHSLRSFWKAGVGSYAQQSVDGTQIEFNINEIFFIKALICSSGASELNLHRSLDERSLNH